MSADQPAPVTAEPRAWSRPITGDFAADLAELDVLARRCAALGTHYLRVMSYRDAGLDAPEWGRRVVERMRERAGRAEQAGLVLLHENCTGWAGASTERMLHLLDAVGSPALALLFDTGNGVAYRYEAYDLLAQVVDHVEHVHVKEATGGADAPRYTVPGAGRARVADCLRLLLRAGYTGAWSIDPHLSVRPHEPACRPTPAPAGGRDGAAGREAQDGFVACGMALERLVREQVLPEFPDWSAAPGGLVRQSTDALPGARSGCGRRQP